MYARLQQSYYMREPQPLLSRDEFANLAPIIVVDVIHQNEVVNTVPIDIKEELASNQNLPTTTTAYCVLIHDRLLEYTPLTGEMRRLV